MLEKDDLLNTLLAGKTIREISCGPGSAELRCDDELSLTLNAVPNVMFHADEVAERFDNAPIQQKLNELVGQTITGVRIDAMGDYCMGLGELAVLRVGKGHSFSGETGVITDKAHSALEF